jgi:type VI secretion system ImpA family protein
MDVEELLAPVSEDAPTGEDLTYDAERGTIEQAFDSSVSIDTSGEESAGAEIDWRPIISLIEQQSLRTKDVWLAIYLCRAGAKSGQLTLVETGAQYLAGLLERYWESVHPKLEEYGFQGRKGPCESLCARGEFLGPLERIPLLEHPRLGRFTGADFERFRAGAEAAEGFGLFRAALADTPEETLTQIVERLEAISSAIRRADAVLVANAAGDETGANFQPAYDLLALLKRAVQSFTHAPAADVAETEQAGGEASGDAPPSGGPRIAGRVESREDVVKALDAIAEYYRRREPTSPVQAVLQRAKEWVNLDFLSLLEDIAPGSIDEAKRVLVIQRKPPEGPGR